MGVTDLQMDTQQLDTLIFQLLSTRMESKYPMEAIIEYDTLVSLTEAAQEVLSEEKTVLQLQGDIYAVGDIHGSIDDLIRIFEKCGYPPKQKYIFLGDYVDRGEYGLEVVSLLLALKVKYPDCVYLLRGNHEIERISSFYGFYDEIALKYSLDLYKKIHYTFNFLPIAAVIQKKAFCVHGGLGPNIPKIEDLIKLNKPEDVSGDNVFVDMLWSDPRDQTMRFHPSKRGSGFYFNKDALQDFLTLNNLQYMIRSHEMCQNGFDKPFTNDSCITIFSNTDYCGLKNDATVLHIHPDGTNNLLFIPYLTPEEKQKHRVVLPEWLLELNLNTNISSASSGVDSDLSESEEEMFALYLSSVA
ncbi:Ser/Thr protein phosphatase, putative [Trichomonas vaginalis G3]|uniref:Serine/threonine-protein phosphatase n=1 Tax=Trichomonas vaginalis (strain ATCC PRA-98 / G3) TaxID=412133 RepID=A2FYA0_TRIV3|nr:phosphoprotein phosphatase protein [Trichomonas vaginalis G3]EAX90122.1 Ser/Thr protein phosphatase, putative [Trichomonas vaginalis G3]KAI5533812.1 phosphoprotein phosphatase protein [Trichomonas vaginalis G3]|eukprot:XP_001303052.1 Ser/Thr protein phosphatase [Trichomonas vaginalis G3]